MGQKLVDERYLAELRSWVGEQVFTSLANQAADNLEPPLADLAKAWSASDSLAAQDAAHRLKGAAASIGFSALAEAARQVMVNRDGWDAPDGVTLPVLRQLTRQSLQALESWQRAQAQVMPVPAKPQ
ncbi:MAG: Hpt domain-containing protein [Magnetospirillum sp.]